MLHNNIVSYFLSVRSRHFRYWLAVLGGVLLSLVLPTGAALAVPVAPDDVQFTQPDGTVIVATPFGDEWYSGYDYQGYTILLDDRTGYWVYAEQAKNGQLVPGQWKAGIDKPPLNLSPHLRDSLALQNRSDMSSKLAPDIWPGAAGTQKVLVILTNFTPSTSRGTTDAQWNQLFFDSTAGAKSVKNFYDQASFGSFSLAPAAETYGTTNDGVVAVTLGYAHPNPYPTNDDNRLITRNALLAADPYINFSSFDTNGNGALDVTELHLLVIVRGFEKSYGGTSGSCTPSVWGHRWSLGGAVPAPILDGVTVASSSYNGGYTQEGEWHEFINLNCGSGPGGHMATMGIMAHELGHDIDWPDLYDTDGSSEGVGSWSVMSSGSWGRTSGSEYQGFTPVLPDAFLKWYQRWITPVPVTAPQTGVALPNSAQNPAAYLLGVNPGGIDWDFGNASGTGEYFLVENRQLVGFDTGLWGIDSAGNAKGCLIWHIDETRTSTNSANATETRKLVDVEEADGPPQDMDFPSGSGGNRGDAGDPWPGSTGETTFGAASDPNSTWYSDAASGIRVSNISTAGTGCTVDYSEVGPAWDGSDSTLWNAAGNWTVNRVPNQNENAVIPSGVPNWPDVNAAASLNNLTILNGAHVNASANVSLDVYGNWAEAGSGYFYASAGTVLFRGSTAQSVTSGVGSHFNHLQIGNGSTSQTVTAGSDLDVNGNLTIQPGARLAMGSHTLRVGGNWTDNPFGFNPGSGTVILDGTSQSVQRAANELVVYSNDLSSLSGWLTYDANGGGYWSFSSSAVPPNSPDHGNHGRYFYSTNAADDWLFSPGFTLQAGVTYAIRFNYGAWSASYQEKLAVHIGATQSVGAMATQLFDNNNVTNTTWQPGNGTFTPGSTGVYYVGFHCYSNANMRYPAIDDLVVAAPDPDLAFYNLSIAGTSTATFADNTAVQNNLAVDAGGMLVLGAYNLTVEGSVVNNGALAQTRTINGASTPFLNLKNRAGTVDKYLGAIIDPGSSNMGSTLVTIWGSQYCPMATRGVRRCFELDPTTPQTAAVTFYYTEAERNGVVNPNMKVYHWNGSTWISEMGATTRGGSGNSQWVRVTGIAAYSPFSLDEYSPSAVSMASFDVKAIGDGSVLLEWQTANELDLLGFYLYRAESELGTPLLLNNDMILAQWPGSATGGGYSFQDQTTIPGITYYYWIEVISIGGLLERYGPVRVDVMPVSGSKTYLPLVMSTK